MASCAFSVGTWSQTERKNATVNRTRTYNSGGVALILYLNHWCDLCLWVGGEPNQGNTQQLCLCQLRTDSGKNGNIMIWECQHIW